MVSGRRRGKTRGWAAGGECVEEAEKHLSCVRLWENAKVLKSGPEGLPHFRGASRNRSE